MKTCENAIEIHDLVKTFGELRAVDGISFSVGRGELFAFLGVNGAGKSTTISIICGQLTKDSGEVIIDGEKLRDNASELKRRIGVVFQSSVLDCALRVRDILLTRAALYGMSSAEAHSKLDELDGLIGLHELYSQRIGKLSGGQRRRVDIARALIHSPEILILDEPTTGLDPQTRKNIWNVISSLQKKENMTVFLTTHYMEESADADRVVILDSGKIVASGTPYELKTTYTGDFISLYNANEADVKALGRKYEKIPDGYRIYVENTAQATELIIAHPKLFSDYEVMKGKMDDVFLSVTGKKLMGEEKQ